MILEVGLWNSYGQFWVSSGLWFTIMKPRAINKPKSKRLKKRSRSWPWVRKRSERLKGNRHNFTKKSLAISSILLSTNSRLHLSTLKRKTQNRSTSFLSSQLALISTCMKFLLTWWVKRTILTNLNRPNRLKRLSKHLELSMILSLWLRLKPIAQSHWVYRLRDACRTFTSR